MLIMKEVESEVANVENCESDTIPHDIIEVILLQLPVKDLIRYKVVSKQWKATISDPSFAQTHLQQYNNSSSPRNLFASYINMGSFVNPENFVFPDFYVAKLQKNRFEFMPRIKIHFPDFSWKNQWLYSSVVCNCDGLYLIHLSITLDKEYVVCNPSCRGYKKIHCPQKIHDSDSTKTLYGIYYNPLMMDYRVVIADKKHYAVFSCRYNKWSEVKEMEEIFCNSYQLRVRGVSFNGSLYWLDAKRVIICFDGKDEKFKKIDMPDCKGGREFHLASSPDHLCLFYISHHNEIVIMKTVKGDEKESWIEFKVQLQSILANFLEGKYPIWVSEEDVIIFGQWGSYYIIYDASKNTMVTQKISLGDTSLGPFPYLENLFLQ